MTQEEKELLLKDLCARLPYGVKCYYNSPEIDDDVPEGISVIKGFQNEGLLVEIESGDIIDIDYVKPYLRSMSSMTEDERNEWHSLMRKERREQYLHSAVDTSYYEYFPTIESFDYLNSHHFDYRGLIPMGLALEAPEGMYKFDK